MWSKFKEKSLIPYITYGDPNREFTEDLIQACIDAGADAIEIGVPFSDPIADGPVIQASHQRALLDDPQVSFEAIFKTVEKFKNTTSTPFILMSAVNLIYQFGIEKFFKQAKIHGVDAVVIPDLTVEESDSFYIAANRHEVAIALLVSAFCSKDRLKRIVEKSEGFIYLISSTGTTGVRSLSTDGLAQVVMACKKIKNIPVFVGFGVSNPEHVSQIWGFAQGAIVGSHLVKIVETHLGDLEFAKTKIAQEIKALKGTK